MCDLLNVCNKMGYFVADLTESSLQDELYYREQIQRRIAEANHQWGCVDGTSATTATEELPTKSEVATGELSCDRATKVQFASDIQYFYCTGKFIRMKSVYQKIYTGSGF